MYVRVSSLQPFRGQNWTVLTSKTKILKFISNCTDFAYLAIFGDCHIHRNKLFKFELPQELRNLCTCIFVTANQGTELNSKHFTISKLSSYVP